jgi:hypothetical protein
MEQRAVTESATKWEGVAAVAASVSRAAWAAQEGRAAVPTGKQAAVLGALAARWAVRRRIMLNGFPAKTAARGVLAFLLAVLLLLAAEAAVEDSGWSWEARALIAAILQEVQAGPAAPMQSSSAVLAAVARGAAVY